MGNKGSKNPVVSSVEIGTCTLRVARNRAAFSSAAPLLVFNGLGLNLETLFPLMRALDGVDAITLDIPGIGGSSARLLPFTFRELAQLAMRVLDHFGIDRFCVMGISWGAGIAMDMARYLPVRCEKLIVASGSMGMPTIPKGMGSLLELTNPRRFFDREYLRKRAGSLYGGKFSKNPLLVEEYLDTLARHKNPMAYYQQLFASCYSSSVMGLHRIRQPVLVMVGREDLMLSRVNAMGLLALIPHSRLVSLDDGHMFFYSSARETAQAVMAFMGEQE